jgi:hypothetical protein
MTHRPFIELTEEYRRTRAMWMRGMAIFYGCIALLVFGLIALTRPSSIAPDDGKNHQTWSAGLQSERMHRKADVPWRMQ